MSGLGELRAYALVPMVNDGTTHNFPYDNNGNLTVAGAFLNPNYSYVYDAQNRLIEVWQGANQIPEYAYDDLDRRISKDITSGIITTYVYNGNQVIAEYEDLDSSGPLDIARKFIYGPGIDEPICMITYDDEGSETGRYWYHFDALGSVVALSQYNSTLGYAEIKERYIYTAFGATTVCDDTGTPRTPNQSAYDNPYMFTGRRYDSETATAAHHGLYYYRARVYAPDLGRFLQPDPIGYADGMNMYAYVGNNPLAYSDPSGLCKSTYYEDEEYEGDPALIMMDILYELPGFLLDLLTDRGRRIGSSYGEEALDYYAYRIAFEGGGIGSYTGAFFSGMYTPETYDTTTITLASAYIAQRGGRSSSKPSQSVSSGSPKPSPNFIEPTILHSQFQAHCLQDIQ